MHRLRVAELWHCNRTAKSFFKSPISRPLYQKY